MLDFLRRPLRRLSGRDARVSRPHDARVQLHLPNPYGGAPWMTATVALSTIPHGQGETLRLRAHIDGCLRLPGAVNLHQRLGQSESGPRSLTNRSRGVAASLVRRAVERVPAERLEFLSSRRWRSWLDVQLSTSPLDGGAEALMPERLRGVYGSGLPRARAGEPRIGVWSGPAGGVTGGVAELVLLQLDERDFGVRTRKGARPGFNLNASIAQLVEPASSDDPGD